MAQPPLRRRLPDAGEFALAALVALYVAGELLGWPGVRREVAGDAIQLAIGAEAAWLAGRAWVRTRGTGRLSRAWGLVALALVAETAGQLAQLVEEAGHGAAYPSPADPFYLAFYPLLLAGVLTFPTTRRSSRQSLALALDVGIVTLAGVSLVVLFILGSNGPSTDTPLGVATAIGYPIGGMTLMLALGWALLPEPLAPTRRSLLTIGAAVAIYAVGDLVTGYVLRHGSYQGGGAVDILYALAVAGLGLAAARQRPRAQPCTPRPAERATFAGTAWLPYLAMTGILGSLLVSVGHEALVPGLAVTIVVAVSGTMVAARQMLHQRDLRESALRLAQAQEIAQIGSYEWDVEHDEIRHSEEDLRLYGVDREAAPHDYEGSLAFVHPDDRERVRKLVRRSLIEAEPFSYEMRVVRPDGDVRTLLSRGDVELRGGRVVAVHGTHQDITERRRIEDQMRYEAEHDPLTGLYNRAKLADELERALRYAARYRRHGALLTLDVDDFKVVNDTLGHGRGDELLKALAQSILRRIRAADVVAHLGGDEFAVVLPEADADEAVDIAEEIRAEVARHRGTAAVRLSAAVVPFDGEHAMVADEALVAADIAMYEAKEAGKDRVRVYRGRAGAAVTWVERIRSALADGRFELYGQPILDLHTNAVIRHELLLRMRGEDGSVVDPDTFLPVAERFGLIGAIDRWVVVEGLRIAAGGRKVSINLSARSIGDAGILATLSEAIASGLDASHVIFEITETAAMENMREAREFTEELVALGCDVAIDDFGTGFGSFTYLKYLPARYLKIDMEFVRDMLRNDTDRQVVDAIAKVAHSLGKLTIAEGVEDAATLEALRDLGVDGAQGFLVGVPAPIHPSVLARRSPRGLRRRQGPAGVGSHRA